MSVAILYTFCIDFELKYSCLYNTCFWPGHSKIKALNGFQVQIVKT